MGSLSLQKVLNHEEPGVTKVYDWYSYDREKEEALNAWGVRLAAILDSRQDNPQSASDEPAMAAISMSGRQSNCQNA